MHQQSFSDLEYNSRKKQSKREKFLNDMDRIIPWQELLALITPYDHNTGAPGRQPISLEVMVRIYFLQQWYTLSDPGAAEALLASHRMRQFVGISINQIPDATTMLNFRHFLEKHQLTEQMCKQVNDYRQGKGRLVKQCTLVDATITEQEHRHNKAISKCRSRVEHAFHTIKCTFGYRRVRHKGLSKNTVQRYSLFMLANLYRVRRQLTG